MFPYNWFRNQNHLHKLVNFHVNRRLLHCIYISARIWPTFLNSKKKSYSPHSKEVRNKGKTVFSLMVILLQNQKALRRRNNMSIQIFGNSLLPQANFVKAVTVREVEYGNLQNCEVLNYQQQTKQIGPYSSNSIMAKTLRFFSLNLFHNCWIATLPVLDIILFPYIQTLPKLKSHLKHMESTIKVQFTREDWTLVLVHTSTELLPVGCGFLLSSSVLIYLLIAP